MSACSLVDEGMDATQVGWRRSNLALTPSSRQSAEPLGSGAIAFEDVYQAHHRDVTRHVILLTRGRDDVDEIVAETFARAFAAWRSGHGPAGRPLPWLLVIARRISTDRWRRRRLITWLPLPDGLTQPIDWHRRTASLAEPATTDSGAAEAEFWLWLDALSRALPARQRDVLILRYQRDLSDAEIGEILGLSASGVRTAASRAVSSLRRHPELWSR